MSFKSWHSYWRFRDSVANCSRYIFDEETIYFLDEVLRTCKTRKRTIKKDEIFWRSQLGHDTQPMYDNDDYKVADEPCPYPPERMHPLKFAASEGRANPKGIPYLYLATCKETAMSEVRPWIGSTISLAQFRIRKELTVIDCSVNHSAHPAHFLLERGDDEPSDEEISNSVWTDIDLAFSKPVTQNDSHAYYAPTQVLAELFKKEGFDGVYYKSMLAAGHNVALFDPEIAEMLNCFLYEAEKITFEFHETASPYFIKKSET
jgi:hypothetical protein